MKRLIALSKYLRRKTPERASIRWKAHAATIAFAALVVPSLCAIYFWRAGHVEDEPYWVKAANAVWIIHGVVAAIAIFFWLSEKPTITEYLPADGQSPRRHLAPTEEAVRARRRLSLVFLAIVCFLLWSTYSQIEMAYGSWRWGRVEKAIGRAVSAGILLFVATFIGKAAWILWNGERNDRAQKKGPNKAPEPTPGPVTPRATEGASK